MPEAMDWSPIPTMETGPGQHAMLLIAIDNLLPLEQLFGDQLASDILKVIERRLDGIVPRIGQMWKPQHRRFAIVVPGMSEDGARSLSALIQAEVAREQIETASGPVAVTVSIGCAVLDNSQLERLGNACHDALIEAMANGVGSVRVARSQNGIEAHRTQMLTIAQTTMRALGAGRLTIAFQPIVASINARNVAFHECLARIQLDNGRLISARDFMPAIEALGLATIVDRQVLGLALATLKEHRGVRLAINLFPQTMQDTEWMALFRNAVREDRDLAERLIIEVTETGAVLDAVRTRKFIESLRDLGVAFALDDFGSGHTSFGHLRDFRFDMIKIDGAFVRDIRKNPDNRFFVKTLIAIAERFEMMTVAESVQDAEDAQVLADLGVGYFQGFFFGTPSLVLEPQLAPEKALNVDRAALH